MKMFKIRYFESDVLPKTFCRNEHADYRLLGLVHSALGNICNNEPFHTSEVTSGKEGGICEYLKQKWWVAL
jgi:hypothetical protein